MVEQDGGPRVEAAARTHVGHVRQRNEDCAVLAGSVLQADRDAAEWRGAPGPVLVAALDGLGGHPDGDVASRTAAESLVAYGDPQDVGAAIRAAHEGVLQAVAEGRGRAGMGTTVVAAVVTDDEVVVGSVGDSGLMVVDDGGLEQLTTVDRAAFGGLTAFAGDGYDDPDPHVRTLRPDGRLRLLLATDGLTDVLDEGTAAPLAREGSPSEAAAALVDATVEAGAPDNVTVVVLDVVLRD